MRSFIVASIAFIIGAAVFFFVGVSSVKIETETIYVKGETIEGSVPEKELVPEKEEKPLNPVLPMKSDTVWRDSLKVEYVYINSKVDTAAIIADFLTKRFYENTLFDNDKQGKLTVFTSVYQNRQTSIDYKFEGREKQTTKEKTRTMQPFSSASYSTLNNVSIGGGVFYHNLGLEYQYQVGFKDTGNGHSFGLKYKF